MPSHTGDGKGLCSGFVEGADADEATKLAITDMLGAGLEAVSDGEQRRDSYIMYHVKMGMTNVDFENRTEHVQRGGVERTMAPTVRGPIEAKASGFLVDDFKAASAIAGKPVFVSIPGPMTVVDTLHDAHYNNGAAYSGLHDANYNGRSFARAVAKALRSEIDLLVAAGCKELMIDEPVFVRYVEQARDWGVELLSELVDGLPADVYTSCHICCSYPTCPEKANPQMYVELAPLLAASKVQCFSVEHAWHPLNLEAVKVLGDAGKHVILGVSALREPVESVEEIVTNVEEALKYIKPEQLRLGPDCGLVVVSRETAIAKAANISKAANIINERLAAKEA